ncbi:hypothetical protein B0H10DRAFT_2223726 [Mycena sp. CBHHK59/15]|nr:hypothetical protein B0H10DRAFT_2223726 [Mycena sp. CBHHK59/15]
MLEKWPSRTEIRFALSSLQRRLTQADKHICSYLSSIRETLTGQAFSDRVESVDSTISEVRELYGTGTPTQELYRLLARRDYGRRAEMINAEAYRTIVDSINIQEKPLPRPYKPRPLPAVPTMKETLRIWDAPREVGQVETEAITEGSAEIEEGGFPFPEQEVREEEAEEAGTAEAEDPPGQPESAGLWQLNHKLNISILPSWDGDDVSVIDYVESMARLAAMGPLMHTGIAQLAPAKFSGRALTWWSGLTDPFRAEFSQNWDYLLDALRRQFLTSRWLLDRTREFEEMRFRQRGHENENPADFFTRRKRYHSFLFEGEEDGLAIVARILRTQPPAWTKDVNENTCPTIRALLYMAEHDRDGLLSAWTMAKTIHALANVTRAPARLPVSQDRTPDRQIALPPTGEEGPSLTPQTSGAMTEKRLSRRARGIRREGSDRGS